MTHYSCIDWVQVGGVWALCVLHFRVCPKLACCSCVCYGLEVRLRILSLILDLLWRHLIHAYWASFRPTVYSSLNWLQCSSLVIGFLLMLLWAFLTHYIACGLLWPICFPWASSAHFLILHSHGFLLTLLGFLDPITISFILGVHGLSINPLLS